MAISCLHTENFSIFVNLPITGMRLRGDDYQVTKESSFARLRRFFCCLFYQDRCYTNKQQCKTPAPKSFFLIPLSLCIAPFNHRLVFLRSRIKINLCPLPFNL